MISGERYYNTVIRQIASRTDATLRKPRLRLAEGGMGGGEEFRCMFSAPQFRNEIRPSLRDLSNFSDLDPSLERLGLISNVPSGHVTNILLQICG